MAEKEKPRVDKEKIRSEKAARRRAKAATRSTAAMAETDGSRAAVRGTVVPKSGPVQVRPPSEQAAKVRGGFQSVKKYLKAVKTEFYRVTWPTGKELRAATIVVIAILVVVTFYLYVVNEVFSKAFLKMGG